MKSHTSASSTGDQGLAQQSNEGMEAVRNAWNWVVDLVLLAALLACAFKFTSGVGHTMDVSLADEGIYLNYGRQLETIGLVEAAYAPLYQLWYYGLSKVVSDPIDLYHTNYRVLVCLLVGFFFVALRRCGVGSIFSFFAAVYVLNSFAMLVWPFCSSLAATVLLAALAIAAGWERLSSRLAVLLVGLMLAAYLRPELFVAAIALLACLIVCAVAELVKCRKLVAGPIVASVFGLVVSSLLIIQFGSPFSRGAEGEGSRTFIAFGQHYSLKAVMASGEEINPWINWRTIIARDFADAETIPEAMVGNPTAFGWNILNNAKFALETIPKLFIPNKAFLAAPWWRTVALLAIVVGIVVWFRRSEKSVGKRHPIAIDRSVVVLFACLMLSLLPSALLIFPRSHYAVPAAAIGMLMIAITFYRRMPQLPRLLDSQMLLVKLLIVIVFAALITPRREQAPHRTILNDRPMTIVKTSRLLRQLSGGDRLNVLGSEPSWHIYVDPSVWSTGPVPAEGLMTTLEKKEINVIVDDRQLRILPQVAQDKQFLSLLDQPEKLGFVAVEISEVPAWRILVRKDLSAKLR